MRELLRRLHYVLNRRRMDADLAEEMEFHREMAAKHEGMPLGDSQRLREDSREAWGFMWIDRLGQDLRFAFRSMRTSPGFTVAAVLVLAIGIGATVTAFASFNVTVLRPLPITDPHSLLRFQRQGPEQFWSDVPYPAVSFYRDNARTLSAVLALTTANLRYEEEENAPRTSLPAPLRHRDAVQARNLDLAFSHGDSGKFKGRGCEGSPGLRRLGSTHRWEISALRRAGSQG